MTQEHDTVRPRWSRIVKQTESNCYQDACVVDIDFACELLKGEIRNNEEFWATECAKPSYTRCHMPTCINDPEPLPIHVYFLGTFMQI